MSYAIEQEMLAGDRSESNVLGHRACVTGATLTAVAFLEATANELFADAAQLIPGMKGPRAETPIGVVSGALAGLSEHAINRFRNLWNLNVPKRASYSILDKFEIALALADKEPFDRGLTPYQEIQLLVKLRNEWIHYEPSWTAEHEERPLRGLEGRFPPAPSRDKNMGKFSLHDCISHGCAEWAVLSTVKFTDEFFKKMGIRSNYENFRSKILTR